MPATIIMPKTRDINDGKKIILKFDTPAIFKAIISSDWTNFKNKIIEEIKKIYDPEIPVNIYELG